MLQLTTIIFLIGFSLLAGIHILATELYLYWYFFWFDIPMHLFGGAVVALGFFTLRDLRLLPNSWLMFWKIPFLVLSVALVWESFELFTGIPIESNFFMDTAIDLCVGVLGGYAGYYIGIQLRSLR